MMIAARPFDALDRRSFLGGSLAVIGTPALSAGLRSAAPEHIAGGVRAAIDKVATGIVAGRKSPGLVVAVAGHGRILYANGYGMADLERAVPARPEAVFRIGSVTKQFTVAAVLKLAELGKLDLDERVSRHLPEFPDADRFTLRQVLSNTSGLANFQAAPGFADFTRGERSTLEMLAYIADQRPRFSFEPGTKWGYSSSGFYLAGVVVERLAGKPFGTFLHEQVLAPAGLTHTAMDRDGDVISGRVAGYDADPAAPSGFANASYASLTVPGGAGGLRSTAADLVAWHAALFGGRVLRPESVAEMTRPARLSDGSIAIVTLPLADEPLPETHYGFGLFLRMVDGRPSVGHAGGINGFSCFHESYPASGQQLLVLANCNKIGITAQLPLSRALFGPAA